MKLFDRLIFSEVFSVFLFAVLGFTAIVWFALGPVTAALRYVAMGIPTWLIVEIVSLNIPPIFVYAFPISMLLAAIFTFVRLSENSEAVAFFAGGISLYRMLLPTGAAALIVTAAGLIINNSLVPYAVWKVTDFKTNISKEIKPVDIAFGLPPIRDKNTGKLQATVWVEGGFDEHANMLRGVTINQFDPKTGQPITTIHGDYAKWDGGYNWTLEDVTILGVGMKSRQASLVTSDIQAAPGELTDFEVDPDTLNFFQLARRIGRLRAEHASEVPQDETDLWEKISLPLASLIFAMVGAPLGLRPQRGNNRLVTFASGFGVIVIYYILREYLQILATSGSMDPFVAAFLPDLLGIAAAVYLIWRAPT